MTGGEKRSPYIVVTVPVVIIILWPRLLPYDETGSLWRDEVHSQRAVLQLQPT